MSIDGAWPDRPPWAVWTGGALLLALLLLAAVLVAARRRSTAHRRAGGASESLLPTSEPDASMTIGRQLRQFSVASLFSHDGGAAATEQPCMPCTCDCGSPLCAPAPCSRAAAADARVQLAELEAALAADPRTAELLRKAACMPPSGLSYVSACNLFARKLIGQCGSARAALELLDHALEFRAAHSIDQILRTPLPPDFLAHVRAVMPHGLHKTDKWGHPLYIERIGHIVPSEMACLWAAGAAALPPTVGPRAGSGGGAHGASSSAYARLLETRMNAVVFYHFQMVEYARIGYGGGGGSGGEDAGGAGASKMVSVLDLSELRLSMFASKACVERLGSLARLGDLLAIENLAAIWVVNAPWFFAAAWKAMSHLLVPRTAEKMRVLSPAETGPFLRQMVPPANLPAWLGGECNCDGGCVSARDGSPSAGQREMDRNICAWASPAAQAAATHAPATAGALAGAIDADADARQRARRASVPPLLLMWLIGPLGLVSRCFAAAPASPAAYAHGGGARELSPISARAKLAAADATRPQSATPSASASECTEQSHARLRCGPDNV